MEIVKGSVVISKAGRDKDSYLAVMQVCEKGVYVSDGKERPVERPKFKNPKHLQKTHYVLSQQETTDNRTLYRALKSLRADANESEVS